jgi:hypothetical protein
MIFFLFKFFLNAKSFKIFFERSIKKKQQWKIQINHGSSQEIA